MNADSGRLFVRSLAAAIAFGAVVILQLLLVGRAGTDIPYYDQWGVEGRWLAPEAQDGAAPLWRVFIPHNEHRIVWTHLLNLILLWANGGQWDPFLQQAVNALLHGCVAGLVVWFGAIGFGAAGVGVVATTIALAFAPVAGWHNALWGFQSQVYFVLGFSLFSLALLGEAQRTARRTTAGLVAGTAALLAMGPGALVPVALLGLAALKIVEARRIHGCVWRLAWPALVLLGLALALRVSAPAHGDLGARNVPQFFLAAARMLSWPHVAQPISAFALNLPLLLLVAGRFARRRTAAKGEDFVLLAAGWSVAIAVATAWMRGGSDELAVGVPSRYVDFIVLLPLANLWCAIRLATEVSGRWKRSGIVVVAAWCTFLLVGWVGLSAEVMRGLILPRMRDRDAPVRLMQAFQQTGDVAVFAGQPRLYVPHPQPEATLVVMRDPRLEGLLPPSLQPERPMGPLSRGVRVLLGR